VLLILTQIETCLYFRITAFFTLSAVCLLGSARTRSLFHAVTHFRLHASHFRSLYYCLHFTSTPPHHVFLVSCLLLHTNTIIDILPLIHSRPSYYSKTCLQQCINPFGKLCIASICLSWSFQVYVSRSVLHRIVVGVLILSTFYTINVLKRRSHLICRFAIKINYFLSVMTPFTVSGAVEPWICRHIFPIDRFDLRSFV
jgi:hypothetical protein